MRKSIRWRLQVWYGLVLLGVVTGFAGLLFYRVRAGRFQEIDAGLLSAAQYLDANLRRLPPPELGHGPPPPEPGHGPPPPPLGIPLPWPFRRPPAPRRALADVALPPTGAPGSGRDSRPMYFGIWRGNGTLLKANDLPADLQPPAASLSDERPTPQPRQRGMFREIVLRGPHESRIVVGQSVQADQQELAQFAWQLLGLGVVVLAVGLAGGWLVSGRILKPVAVISATASAISAANLNERLDVSAVDRELAELAGVLNAMFARLEAAFERQSRFTADASHELRTPLAIVRSHAQLALARPRSVEEYRETLDACLRASGRMTVLVDGLLMLARAEAGKLDLKRETVDLRSVVEECIALFRPLAQGKQVAIDACLAEARTTGDAPRLEQVVTNLLSNALQYNRTGGRIAIKLERDQGNVVLSVQDTGCGIPAEDQPHIFERFYRVDKARARASGGNGLGLAICKSIVEAHGGTMDFESTVGTGTLFRVMLPEEAVLVCRPDGMV